MILFENNAMKLKRLLNPCRQERLLCYLHILLHKTMLGRVSSLNKFENLLCFPNAQFE